MPTTPTAGSAPQGLRAVVTAGAGGIGLAIAEKLAGEGARVLVCDVDDKALAAFAGRLPGHHAVKADVSDEGDVDRLFDAARERLGGLDALVNNAGIAGPTGGVDEIAPADWRRCIDTSLTGQFLCARRAVPMLRQAKGGSIVGISSVAGKYGYAFRTPYSAAKFGVVGLTQSLAKELGPDNIRVNAILPGIVEGARMDGVIAARAEQVGVSFDEMKTRYLERVSMRRMVTAGDVAEMVAFLVSPAGRHVSGQSIAVDGNVETL